ncbi:hypothetical protein T069G_02817 [Trichoderma breve]|uniref:Uncharacterized protein n=1 Tax=Trichoderma breve TaxID=2034170 RepID=A0A9W9BEJ8_9HYPO|nr:hypothetical protein T069G_02817 [Trichoderma breve]KAJ4861863.1 hypothetical protein T069G_02817 [Trichoderma breve]
MKKGPRVAEERDSRVLSDDSEEKPLKKQAAQKSRVSNDDSEGIPLGERRAQKKRPRVPVKKDNRVAKDDSEDDDQPLFNILKKRAKKIKIMPSREKSSSFD